MGARPNSSRLALPCCDYCRPEVAAFNKQPFANRIQHLASTPPSSSREQQQNNVGRYTERGLLKSYKRSKDDCPESTQSFVLECSSFLTTTAMESNRYWPTGLYQHESTLQG